MFKGFVGVFVGVLLGGVTIAIVGAIGQAVYPVPADIDTWNTEELRDYLAGLPLGALLFGLAANVAGTFVAGFIAGTIGKTTSPVWIVGLLLLLGGVANVEMTPCPLWFAIVSLASILPSAWLGGRVAGARKMAAGERQ